ncbi:hypothetical protein ACQ143_07780 [Microbacterium sp. MC2]
MYAALWRILPGPAWVRVLILLVAAAAILYGLFFHAFPWISHFITPTESTLGG